MNNINNLFDAHTHNCSIGRNRMSVWNYDLISCNIPVWEFEDGFGSYYSIGLHPWYLKMDWRDYTKKITVYGVEQSLFIGECGFDRLRYQVPMEVQIEAFEAMAAIAEKYHKPMIIHCVSAFDVLLAEKKKLNPTVRWIIHGFRGKPKLLQQLVSNGMYISFGEHFNPESLKACPLYRMFFETDEFKGSVYNIYERASVYLDISVNALDEIITSNILPILKENSIFAKY